MNNYQFLKTYLLLQKDIILTSVSELPNGILSLSKDTSAFWNNVLVNSLISESEILHFENELRSQNRSPAFYYENRPGLEKLTRRLEGMEYTKEAEDSFMFHSGEEIDTSGFNCIMIVQTDNDLTTFLKTFDSCYRKDDPMNPYGELGEYLPQAQAAWLNNRGTGRLEYFIAYKNEVPVAVAALTSFKNIGYISNVGSLPSVRGEGFGKLVTLFAVQQSVLKGNAYHCLATEENTNPNSFYKALGFKAEFSALLMVKK